MPSRYRPCDVICNPFVLIVLFKIAFIYYVTIVLVWAPRVEGKYIWPENMHHYIQLTNTISFTLQLIQTTIIVLSWWFTTYSFWCSYGASSRPCIVTQVRYRPSGASTWATTRARGAATAWSAMCSSLTGVTTAQRATDACLIWTITAPGSTIVLDSGTESSSCSFWCMDCC